MGIKEQVEKFGLGAFDLKLFRLEKIEGKAENCNKGSAGNGPAHFCWEMQQVS